jgi:hypothetical protein
VFQISSYTLNKNYFKERALLFCAAAACVTDWQIAFSFSYYAKETQGYIRTEKKNVISEIAIKIL